MADLLSLPDELLIHVISFLEYDRPSLLSLSLTARCFHRLARGFVFRHIELHLNPIGRGAQKFLVRRDLLFRSLKHDSRLKDYVQTAGPIFLYATNEFTDMLLDGLANLGKLWIRGSYLPWIPAHYAHLSEFFDSECARRLREIKVQNGHVQVLIEYLRLPNLTTLNAVDLEHPTQGHCSEVTSSSLRTLRVSGKPGIANLSTEDLKRLAESCPLLEELVCDVHLNAEQQVPANHSLELRIVIEGIAEALRPVQQTLKRLELHMPLRHIVHATGSPINLSHLVALRYLRINGLYLFEKGEHAASQRNIQDCLPPSIESFHIDCTPHTPVFFDVLFEDDLSGRNIEDLVAREKSTWLLQFAEVKRNRCKSLRQVVVQETDVSTLR